MQREEGREREREREREEYINFEDLNAKKLGYIFISHIFGC